MATAPGNLTGIWDCDDGGRYYVMQPPGDSVVSWVGLDTPLESTAPRLFYRGLSFTNVFQGGWLDDGVTISGEWADVPRGRTEGYGLLRLRVSWDNYALRLDRIDATGGFGGSVWRKIGWPLEEPSISNAAVWVRRYDSSLSENNPPCRDYTVMWGDVTDVGLPTLPSPRNSYRAFLDDDWDGDGDIDFSINTVWRSADPHGTDWDDFWETGWVMDEPNPFSEPRASKISALYKRFGHFHAETMMYGRSNTTSNWDDTPDVHVPGWNEIGGNSVLVNGVPVEGVFYGFPDIDLAGGFPYADQAEQKVWFKGRPGVPDSPSLEARKRVRVTGVVAADVGHHSWLGTVISSAPEIHPVYALDIPQDFSLPRTFPLLSGAWHASDNATYYLRQLGDSIWWLGLSRDQGYTYANIFKGALEEGGIRGRWASVPMSAWSPVTHGELVIDGIPSATTLTKAFESPDPQSAGGLTASWWTKLYDAHGTPYDRPIIGPAQE